MKLIYCTECKDVLSLSYAVKRCDCGKSSGRYVDKLNAEIAGPCVALGFSNDDFLRALAVVDAGADWDVEFTAFVISETAKSIRRVE